MKIWQIVLVILILLIVFVGLNLLIYNTSELNQNYNPTQTEGV